MKTRWRVLIFSFLALLVFKEGEPPIESARIRLSANRVVLSDGILAQIYDNGNINHQALYARWKYVVRTGKSSEIEQYIDFFKQYNINVPSKEFFKEIQKPLNKHHIFQSYSKFVDNLKEDSVYIDGWSIRTIVMDHAPKWESDRREAFVQYFKAVNPTLSRQFKDYSQVNRISGNYLDFVNLLKAEKAVSERDLIYWDKSLQTKSGRKTGSFSSELTRDILNVLHEGSLDFYGRNILHRSISYGFFDEISKLIADKSSLINSKDNFGRTALDLIDYYNVRDQLGSDISLSGWQNASIWGSARHQSDDELLNSINEYSLKYPELSSKVNWPLFAYQINRSKLAIALVNIGYSHQILDWEKSSLIEKAFEKNDLFVTQRLAEVSGTFKNHLNYFYLQYLSPAPIRTDILENEGILIDLLNYVHQASRINDRENLLNCLYIIAARGRFENLFKRCVELEIPPHHILTIGNHNINCPLIISLKTQAFKDHRKQIIKTLNNQPPETKVDLIKNFISIYGKPKNYFEELKSSPIMKNLSPERAELFKRPIEESIKLSEGKLLKELGDLKKSGLEFIESNEPGFPELVNLLTSHLNHYEIAGLLDVDVEVVRDLQVSKNGKLNSRYLNLEPYSIGSMQLLNLSQGISLSPFYEVLYRMDEKAAIRMLKENHDPTVLCDNGNDYPARKILNSNRHELISALMLQAQSLPFDRWALVADLNTIKDRIMGEFYFETRYHKFIALYGALCNLAITGGEKKFIPIYQELRAMENLFKLKYMNFVQAELLSISDMFNRNLIAEYIIQRTKLSDLEPFFYPEERELGGGFKFTSSKYLPLRRETWNRLKFINRNLDFLAFMDSLTVSQ